MLVKQLMAARRALRGQGSQEHRAVVRKRVDEAKRALGERGPVWWTDGAPDYNRKRIDATPYAQWYNTTMREVPGLEEDASRCS